MKIYQQHAKNTYLINASVYVLHLSLAIKTAQILLAHMTSHSRTIVCIIRHIH